MKAFENTPKLGAGIYTTPDIAQILRLPVNKVSRWIRQYWDAKLGREFNAHYSWNIGQTKGVNFHTLIELYVFYQLNEAGLQPKSVLRAHKVLSDHFDTLFPFANSTVLRSLHTDGGRVYLGQGDQPILTLDNSNQLNFNFIKLFFKNIDFDGEALARRFWPLGKSKSIVCDPERQFGQAVIGNTNICPETIYNMYKSGEPKMFISSVYGITESQVDDAVEYCEAA